MARSAPSTLRALLVTIPANTSVIPNARIIGHVVGAGAWMVLVELSGVSLANSTAIRLLSLAPDHIYDREDHDPYDIHEMPIQRQNLGAFSVFLSYIPQERENRHRR